MTTLDTVMSFLKGKGLSTAQAAGLAGNWTVESGLNPASSNPREGAIGIAQWEGGRRAALDKYAAATGGSEKDLTTQLNYAWYELNTSESSALQRLLATNDPGTAASVVDQYYERSSGSARAQRITNAQQIAGGTYSSAGGTAQNAGYTAQNAGLLDNVTGWQADVLSIALKFGAGITAAALVVVGIRETTKGKS